MGWWHPVVQVPQASPKNAAVIQESSVPAVLTAQGCQQLAGAAVSMHPSPTGLVRWLTSQAQLQAQDTLAIKAPKQEKV